MQNVKVYFASSIGRKQLIAVTGLIWSGFVLMHMAGNLLLFAGPDTYNKYSHAIVTNPLVYVAEAVLVIALLMHMGLAIKVTLANRAARPIGPARRASNCEKGANFASRTMILSGLLIFVFIVLHLITFKYGTAYTTTVGGVEMRDLYKLVMEKFRDPLFLGWYIFALLVLGLHLSHGIASFVQTLGLGSVRACCSKKAAWTFAFIIAFGFMGPAIYLFLHGGA